MLFKILGVGIVTVISFLTVKQYKPDLAIVVSLAGGLLMSLILIDEAKIVVDEFVTFSSDFKLGTNITVPLLKVMGVGYVTEFCSDLAEDSGNKLLANKIILGGKIAILVIALPIIRVIIESIVSIVV